MTTLYLIRHAETAANAEKRICGAYDGDLSDKGYEQIKMLAAYAPSLEVDIIYTSPLKRAFKTASAFNWYINKPLVINDDLREINVGVWENKLWADIDKASQIYDLWVNNPHEFTIDGGEDMKDVYFRMAAALNEIAEANDGKTAAVFSHGCALRNFMCYAKGYGLERYREMSFIDNVAVNKLIYDKSRKKFAVIYENDAGCNKK